MSTENEIINIEVSDSDVESPIKVDKEIIKSQEIIANETVNAIEKAVQITEDDKKKAAEKVKTRKKKEEQSNELDLATELQTDLQTFINDKVDIAVGKEDIEKLPTGIDLLDATAGGGFGVGTFSMIVGLPGTFKSALAGQLIGTSQKKFSGQLLATYHDAEAAMTTGRLEKMGCITPRIKPYDDVTVENIFKTIEAICSFKQLRELDIPALVLWDSIANTSTEKERTTDDINQTIGLKARLLSALFPRYIPKMRKNKISLIAVNQLRDKMDMGQFGSQNDLKWMGDKVMPGGMSIKFNAFHLLYLKNAGDLKLDQYGFNGVKLTAVFVKNKFFRPNVPISLLVDFNTGISNFWTNYNFLVDTKRIQAGAWNFLISFPNKKFRTKDAIDLYNKNEDGFKVEFDKCIKEAIIKDIIEPNS